MSEERWAPVNGWPYVVSDMGAVARVLRSGERRTLRPVPTHTGYQQVTLSLWPRQRRVMVNRLIAEVFLPPPRDGQVHVAHLNGNRTDNRVANLEWQTPLENNRAKWAHGTMPVGENHHNAKLTDADVERAHQMREQGYLHREIAAELGVVRQTVGRVLADHWGRPTSEWRNAA